MPNEPKATAARSKCLTAARQLERLSLPALLARNGEQVHDHGHEAADRRQRHPPRDPGRLRRGELGEDGGFDPARVGVHEGDALVVVVAVAGEGEVLEREAGHGGGVVDDVDGGAVVVVVELEAEVVVEHGFLAAGVEDAENARVVGRLAEEGEEVLDEAHAAVVGEGEAGLQTLFGVFETGLFSGWRPKNWGETYIVVHSKASGPDSCTSNPPFARQRRSSRTRHRHARGV